MDSQMLIGSVKNEFEKHIINRAVENEQIAYDYFYNGWVRGRMDLHFNENILPVTVLGKNIKVWKEKGIIYIDNNGIENE